MRRVIISIVAKSFFAMLEVLFCVFFIVALKEFNWINAIVFSFFFLLFFLYNNLLNGIVIFGEKYIFIIDKFSYKKVYYNKMKKIVVDNMVLNRYGMMVKVIILCKNGCRYLIFVGPFVFRLNKYSVIKKEVESHGIVFSLK